MYQTIQDVVIVIIAITVFLNNFNIVISFVQINCTIIELTVLKRDMIVQKTWIKSPIVLKCTTFVAKIYHC